MQDLPNGGGGTPQKRQPCRPMWQGGVLIRGGGGADPSIGPRALETLGTPLGGSTNSWGGGGGGGVYKAGILQGGVQVRGNFHTDKQKKKKTSGSGDS